MSDDKIEQPKLRKALLYTTPKSVQLSYYALIRSDLIFAQNCLKLCATISIQSNDNSGVDTENTVKRALFNAACVAYVRCFNSSTGRPQLQISHVAQIDPEAVVFHQYIYDMRDKYIAHSESDYEEAAPYIIPMLSDDETSIINIVTGSLEMTLSRPNEDNVKIFYRLISEILEKIIMPKMQSLSTAFQAEACKLSLEDVQKLPPVRFYGKELEVLKNPKKNMFKSEAVADNNSTDKDTKGVV